MFENVGVVWVVDTLRVVPSDDETALAEPFWLGGSACTGATTRGEREAHDV
jgi:hypothetical protein